MRPLPPQFPHPSEREGQLGAVPLAEVDLCPDVILRVPLAWVMSDPWGGETGRKSTLPKVSAPWGAPSPPPTSLCHSVALPGLTLGDRQDGAWLAPRVMQNHAQPSEPSFRPPCYPPAVSLHFSRQVPKLGTQKIVGYKLGGLYHALLAILLGFPNESGGTTFDSPRGSPRTGLAPPEICKQMGSC